MPHYKTQEIAMIKKLLIPLILLLLGYGLIASDDFSSIAAGIAVFIVGMLFMEDGFRLFTGGILSKILQKTTNTVPKAIFSGFFATAIVQSSSLTSVIAISFVTAELMTLSQAIGVIFGANIGTTATAWIVAAFGMKIKISAYAMPMIVFGLLFTFSAERSYKGFGNILLGLGFIFLGISYMKEGFESMKDGIDLARFAVPGIRGIALYVLVGTVATVIIQSSSATMALIITAVATGQISYINSLALAIGANVGTTITAILGSLTSNANGKRLAVAHLIFNLITALVAIVFIHFFRYIVDILSGFVGIGGDDIAMKLSLFHTIFNVVGVLIVSPFVRQLVSFLDNLFVFQGEKRGRPKYLDHEVVKTPGPALAALYKESEHLYDIAGHTILQALRLRQQDVFSTADLRRVVDMIQGEAVDVNDIYEHRIKKLYGTILQYAVEAETNMDSEQLAKVYKLKLACRDVVEAVKDIRELQKNIARYMTGDNNAVKIEYAFLRENVAETLRSIQQIRVNPSDQESRTHIAEVRERNKHLDTVASKRLSDLLREHKITNNMASSLMNDGAFARIISKKLLKCAAILWAGGVDKQAPATVTDADVLPG